MSIFLRERFNFARKREPFFVVFSPVFFGVFVLFAGCFCAFCWGVFLLCFARARQKNVFFGGGVSKTGNSRSDTPTTRVLSRGAVVDRKGPPPGVAPSR